MNSIEMTDVDGDALAFITREDSTWITCTSGADEVTVGPFPTRLVRGAFASPPGTRDEVTTLIGRTSAAARPAAPSQEIRDHAWAAFLHLAETSSLRGALDGALRAALPETHRPDALHEPTTSSAPNEPSQPETPTEGLAESLAEDLRRIALTDPDALADHLISLGYRKA